MRCKVFVIYLDAPLPTHSIVLPSDVSPWSNRTSRPPTSVYMNFQLPMCTACRVTTTTGGLLPHLLTLTCKLVAGGYFLLDALALTDFSLLGSRLPSSARTFLRCYWHPRLRIYPCLRSHGKSSDFLIAKCNPSEPLRILH